MTKWWWIRWTLQRKNNLRITSYSYSPFTLEILLVYFLFENSLLSELKKQERSNLQTGSHLYSWPFSRKWVGLWISDNKHTYLLIPASFYWLLFPALSVFRIRWGGTKNEYYLPQPQVEVFDLNRTTVNIKTSI